MCRTEIWSRVNVGTPEDDGVCLVLNVFLPQHRLANTHTITHSQQRNRKHRGGGVCVWESLADYWRNADHLKQNDPVKVSSYRILPVVLKTGLYSHKQTPFLNGSQEPFIHSFSFLSIFFYFFYFCWKCIKSRLDPVSITSMSPDYCQVLDAALTLSP